MAVTVFTDVPIDVWTEILDVSLTALISNEAGSKIYWVVAASAPAASVIKGHTLHQGASISRTTGAGEKIYALAKNTPTFVVVTVT